MREIYTPARVGLAAVALIALAGCGGGGTNALPVTSAAPNSGTPTAPNSSSHGNAALSVFIPNRAPAANRRRPQYVGASTQSIAIAMTPASGAVVNTYADVSATSPLCTATSGGRQCTVGLTITPNVTDSFTAVAYDVPVTGDANGYGTGIATGGKIVSLTSGTPVSVTPAATTLTKVNIHLQPVIADVVATTHATIVQAGPNVTPSQVTFNTSVNPLDVDGNVIASGSGDSFVTSSGVSAQVQGNGASTGLAVLVGLSGTSFTSPANGALTMSWEFSQGVSGTPFAAMTPSYIEVGWSASGTFHQTDQVEVDPLWVDQQVLSLTPPATATFTQYLVADTGSTPSLPAIAAGTACKNGSGTTIATLQANAASGNTNQNPATAPVTVTPVAAGTCAFTPSGSVLDKHGETVTGSGPAVTITVL